MRCVEMQNPIESFGTALRAARKNQNLTQKELAEKLGMSIRTIIQAEQGYSNPKFETVVILSKELNISLDAIVFPDSAVTPISKNVVDFFSGKTEVEIQKYISLCQQADSFKSND